MTFNYYFRIIINDFKDLLKNYSIKDRNSILAAKAGLSASIAILLSYFLELHDNLWAPFTCMIMLTPNVGATVEKGFYRFSGTLVGAYLGFLIFGFTVQNEFYYSVCTFFIATICYYMYASARYTNYFWFLIIVSYILVSTVGFGNPVSPEYFMEVAFNRSANVILGVVCYVAVTIMIAPNYATTELDDKLKKLANETVEITRLILDQYVTSIYIKDEIEKRYASLRTMIATLETITHNAIFEKKLDAKPLMSAHIDFRKFTEFLDTLITFYRSSSVIASSYQKNHEKQLKKTLSLICMYLNPAEEYEKISKQIEEQMTIIHLRYTKRRSQGKLSTYSSTEVYYFQEFIAVLNELISLFEGLNPKNPKPVLQEDTKHDEEDKLLGYRKFQIFGFKINYQKIYLVFAMRTALILIIVFWGWKFLDLPPQFNTLEISIAVVCACLPDYVSSNLKGLLRFIGCGLGAIIGCILVGLDIETTTLMLLIVFVVGYVCGRILRGGPGISYMGLQMFLGFCVAFLINWGPALDLDDIFLRFVGIFFGVIAVWILSSILWKTEYFSIIKERIVIFWKKFREFSEFTVEPGSSSPNILLKGIAQMRANIPKLSVTTDISLESQNLLRKWCDASERAAIAIREIVNSPKETKEFVKAADNELMESLKKITAASRYPLAPEECDEWQTKVSEITTAIEQLKHAIRHKFLFKDKDMEFRRTTIILITNMKRLVLRLGDVYKVQKELFPLMRNKKEAKI